MKRHWLFMVGICCALSAAAQDMKSVFIAMPDSVTPLLSKVNREDCVDFLDSNMKARVKNRFDGDAELQTLTEDYLMMQVSEVSTLEMKLLPVNDSTKVICLVRTVCTSPCDSDIKFYTADWSKELSAEGFVQKPLAAAFFLPGDTLSDDAALVAKKADMHLLKASLAKDDASLTFIYTTPDYLHPDDKAKLLPHLRKEPVVLRWAEGKFR